MAIFYWALRCIYILIKCNYSCPLTPHNFPFPLLGFYGIHFGFSVLFNHKCYNLILLISTQKWKEGVNVSFWFFRIKTSLLYFVYNYYEIFRYSFTVKSTYRSFKKHFAQDSGVFVSSSAQVQHWGLKFSQFNYSLEYS